MLVVTETIIPAEVWKFAGGSVRELAHDDLTFLAHVFRRNPKVGAIFDMELRRRALAAKCKAERRSRPASRVRMGIPCGFSSFRA